MKQNSSYIMVLLFCSCIVNPIQQTGSDTSKILKAVLASKQLNTDLVPGNTDSLYFIRSQFYNQFWPAKANRFTIFYIKDSENARLPNKFGLKIGDKRMRIGVPVFKVAADTAEIVLYNFNFHSEITFGLKKKNNEWSVVKAHTLLE
jgi:hypothetical protein